MRYPQDSLALQSPQQLKSILRAIKRALADGTLCQIQPENAAVGAPDLSTLSDSGPWPDYVEAYFSNPKTGENYRLTVETYHGAGGAWERI